ncbi:MAG: hypothetical protein ACHQUC_02885 [Chlamydiales bacterium]
MAPVLIALILFSSVHAADLGTFGHTFPIEEQDILEYIKERILTASPEEKKKLANIQAISASKEVKLPQAIAYRCFFYDPTVMAHQDIKDSKGKVIVAKGISYNPLGNFSLRSNLLFFDATQKGHLLWAEETDGLWILTKGSPIELEEKSGISVYFDQFGSITHKLGIQAIPAKVSQEGNLLKIEEFVLEEYPCN